MKRKRHKNCEKIKTEVEEGDVKHKVPKSSGGVKLGDLIWVKLHPSSWWPAQVVDADSVSEVLKPSERSVGEVLVRVYGSYLYVYVDPSESRTEFDQVLKLYNGNYDQILNESLEKDRPYSCKAVRQSVSGAAQSVVCDKGTKQKGGKLRSAMNNMSREKDVTRMEMESSFQRRVSPRRKFAHNKVETTLMNGSPSPTSEVCSVTGAKKHSPRKKKLRSQTDDNETARLNSEHTGKVDDNISIPFKAVVPISVHPNASVRSKRIMQSLGLMAPAGSPFIHKIQHS